MTRPAGAQNHHLPLTDLRTLAHDPRLARRRAQTARARITAEGDLSCVANALNARDAVTRAAAALGRYDGDVYVPWASAEDVAAALEMSLRAEDVAS